jgi:hypothetical protein
MILIVNNSARHSNSMISAIVGEKYIPSIS